MKESGMMVGRNSAWEMSEATGEMRWFTPGVPKGFSAITRLQQRWRIRKTRDDGSAVYNHEWRDVPSVSE